MTHQGVMANHRHLVIAEAIWSAFAAEQGVGGVRRAPLVLLCFAQASSDCKPSANTEISSAHTLALTGKG